MKRRAFFGAAVALPALFSLAGCAHQSKADGGAAAAAAQSGFWSGRLAVIVEGEGVEAAPQSFSAAFELSGNAREGELLLSTPLGNALARILWQPGSALLHDGKGQHAYTSLDELVERTTGAAVPVRTLFAWLHGQPQDVAGWHADLSGLKNGRLTARRSAPQPFAELRVVLDSVDGQGEEGRAPSP